MTTQYGTEMERYEVALEIARRCVLSPRKDKRLSRNLAARGFPRSVRERAIYQARLEHYGRYAMRFVATP